MIRSTFGFSGSYLLRFVTFYFEIFEKIFLRFLGNLLGKFFFSKFLCVEFLDRLSFINDFRCLGIVYGYVLVPSTIFIDAKSLQP